MMAMRDRERDEKVIMMTNDYPYDGQELSGPVRATNEDRDTARCTVPVE